ncbi:MAG: hypothetical protein ACI9TH_004898 [Kiritimatiellia bacterium]
MDCRRIEPDEHHRVRRQLGDGQTNLEEYQAGTNPTDRADALLFVSIECTDTSTTLSWQSVPGFSYRLEYTDTPLTENWQTAVSGIPSSGTRTSHPDIPRGPQVLYRIICE